MFQFPQLIDLPDARLLFIENFFDPSVSDRLLGELKEKIAWQQGEIMMFGKKIAEPRLSAWYGDEGKTYRYSSKDQTPLTWNDTLLYIKSDIEKLDAQISTNIYNSVLCNFYRNGNDSMGFHADDERELGRNPTIASVNFGETRRFLFRRRDNKTVKYELALSHGSLLIMSGAMQHHWQHAVPKEPRRTKSRINLTFRFIH